MSKTNEGNYFEDFQIGQEIIHATPLTVSGADQAFYTALYGSRFAVYSADTFAQSMGLPGAPLEDLLAFHVVFGKTVPDISLNAVANLGYAEGRFLQPVYPGDTLSASSEVIGLKENSNGKTGVVYVRSSGFNQHGEKVMEYTRWVMVNKRDQSAPAPTAFVPHLADAVSGNELVVPNGLHANNYEPARAGSSHFYEDYHIGEKISHVDGMTIEEAEHQMATRLFQNTAKVHFDQHAQKDSRFGRRLIYGGHVISLARALSFNGLGNACMMLAINGGRHVAPTFAGDTIYAWSEILDMHELDEDFGALRVRLVGLKNANPNDHLLKDSQDKYDSSVVLDFDYWALIPKG